MASQATNQKPIGPALRKLMAEHDVRAEEIAYKLGVSMSTVSRWIAGKVEPPRGTGERLGELFEVDRRVFYDEPAGEAA